VGDYYAKDPVEITRPDGSVFMATPYTLNPGLAFAQGSYLTNGPREQDYFGVSLTFNKRLANRWMMRGNFTLNDWTWNVPAGSVENPAIGTTHSNDDGSLVVQGSGTGSGSKGGIYINSEWQYSLTGMYQVAPDKAWGFNVSAALNGRQGYAIPYFQRISQVHANGGSQDLSGVSEIDEFRHDDIHMMDLRVEKEFGIKDTNFTVGLELFNAFNEATVMQRQVRVGISSSDRVTEILSPRVFRRFFLGPLRGFAPRFPRLTPGATRCRPPKVPPRSAWGPSPGSGTRISFRPEVITMKTMHSLFRNPIHVAVLALLLALALAGAAVAQDWSGRGRAMGRVTDEETGEPLKGVKITLQKDGVEGSGPEPMFTDKKGKWAFLGLRNGDWTVLLDLDDYIPRSANIKVSEFGAGKPTNVMMAPTVSRAEKEAKEGRINKLESAERFMQQGKYAEARTAYEELIVEIKDEGSQRQLRRGIAQTYYQEGNYAAARSTWQTILDSLPEDEPAATRVTLLQGMARSFYEEEKTAEAVKILEKVLVEVPGDVETLKLIINLLVASDRETEAQAYMAQLPEGAKVDADAVLNMGIKLYNDGDLDGALERFNQAVKENAEMADTYYYRGLVYLNKTMNTEALADFKKLLELAPDHANAGEAQQFAEYLESQL
jgi:tetratricopeptide (TPR) repeat protein